MLKNSLYSLVSRLSAAFLKLGSYLYLAKVLNIVEYGHFSFLMAIVYIGSMVMLFGMNNSILQIYSMISNKRLKVEFINYSKIYTLIIAFLSFIVSTVIFKIFYTNIQSLILAFSIFIQIIFMMTQNINLVENKFKKYIWLPIIQLLLFFVIILFLKVNNGFQVIQIYSITCLTAFLFMSYFVKYNINFIRFKILYNKIFQYGKKHLMFEMNNVLINRSDIFILKLFNLDYILGFYSIVKNVIEGLMYIPKSLQPIILKDFNSTNELLLKKINIGLTSFYMLALSFVIIFGEKIISVIWNDEYLIIFNLLIFYLIGFIFYSWGTINSFKLLSYKLFNQAIKINVFYGIMMLISNIVAITVSAEYGIGFSYLFSSILYFLYTFVILSRRSVSSVKGQL